ncbi:hypothetical protein F4803DRAFT_526726 [Xylaria telfairii]|nr:hypothetical protein F4803DRAFT_526726 [Xylaria telfairii]
MLRFVCYVIGQFYLTVLHTADAPPSHRLPLFLVQYLLCSRYLMYRLPVSQCSVTGILSKRAWSDASTTSTQLATDWYHSFFIH